MENAEEIFHFLDDFSKRKPKTIPQELNEYLAYVARTGDPVYQWPLVKCLFKEKLINVITDFYETTPGIEIPPYPNVDPFNYDIMKNSLLERLDSFTSAPFTVQRLCELLTFPRKQYNRIDKFMRAIEKNILVVSTREPGIQRHSETENGEANEPILNGSDNSEYHVDVEMEDMSRKENNEQWASEPQPGSSDTHITVDDIEARLKAKENTSTDTVEKKTTEYESVTPPELNVTTDDSEQKPEQKSPPHSDTEMVEKVLQEPTSPVIDPQVLSEDKKDVEMKIDSVPTLVIPEIRVEDAEMTEQKLLEQANTEKTAEPEPEPEPETATLEAKVSDNVVVIDESSSDSKDESDTKQISEVSTSSEESSSSSDNTDGSSNSPKTDEGHIDIHEESNQSDIVEAVEIPKDIVKEASPSPIEEVTAKIEAENYSISDVQTVPPSEPIETPIEFPEVVPTVTEIEVKSEEVEPMPIVTEEKTVVEENPAEEVEEVEKKEP